MGIRRNYTPEVLEYIYQTSKEIYEKGRNAQEFQAKVEELGMNWNSYRNYFIYTFSYMREGRLYKGKVPIVMKRYMLNRIFEDYGKEGLRLALQTMEKSVKYFEESQSLPQHKDKELIEEFKKKII